jgi:serine protease Do
MVSMRMTLGRAALAALVAAALGGAGTEAPAQYVRRTPVVEAVQKTRGAIVTIKVELRGSGSKKEVVGTGVVVDERGYAVTNRHVIKGAERVVVRLADGSEVVAVVHAEDEEHDLAILHLPGCKKLQELPFAPGSDLMVGETVIAVGHPFGYVNTVSTGIVSAVGREVKMPTGEVLTNCIQTNASINPGNSGGPMLNVNGELIGINVALRDGAQGIAFAMNSDTVQAVLARHLSAARMARVQHGLGCREAVGEEGQPRQWVVVEQVAERSPAARAGLKKGDVIRKLNGRAVFNRFDVERAFWDYHPGDRVEATVLRDGKETQMALVLTRGKDGEAIAARPESDKPRADADGARPVKSWK